MQLSVGKNAAGEKAWSYTHAWKSIPRSNWSEVSILASIDSVKDASSAIKQGYAPALVVSQFETKKAFTLPGSDVSWIPCPNQTKPGDKEITCDKCKLCLNADKLFQQNKGIAFAIHGVRQDAAKKRLNVIR